ncbi:MAG: LysM peptidoglycan-binding domain-containing protein [Rhodocyclaceae bacterium]|jgi:lipoprotein NlpD|nr:LysM peptidoglycan-binding domain-containing protein [Rhodocyclaceae bacterium]
MRQVVKNVSWVLVATVLAGCTSMSRAPVDDGSKVASPYPALPKDCTQTWTVKRGDTLIGIALDAGADYRDIAAMNQLANPNIIQLDRTLCVRRGAQKTAKKVASSNSAAAKTDQVKENSKPMTVKPVDDSPSTAVATQAAMADGVRFAWPAKGKVVAGFNESSNKGINIAGKMGEPVDAAADGKVVYAGSGLRGYGNLVIVKHEGNYLTAYAHNSKILVKEGEAVKRGQRIADMGDSDADSVMLHFEVRRQGKPVDPMKFLTQRGT